ncbi:MULTISPECIES: hypothetical protein [Sphingobacterium]|uniref:hypothetical protein n=1 Tax=Sphingobacterium TaxID=28453 RepID=UPI0013DD046C|nr:MULTISPECIES: hypothetical protein [unclassified Sphingobacterium]
MKNSTIFSLLPLTIIIACRTSKHRLAHQQTTQQAGISESREWLYRIQQDSTKRYWHFASDSVFYFHPEKGLWAWGGWLYTEEQSAHKREVQAHVSKRDSTASQQHASKMEQKTTRTHQLPGYIYWIALLGAAFVGYYYSWRKGM